MSDDFHEGLEEHEQELKVESIYIVTRNFTQTVNGARIDFKKGRVVRDESLLAILLEGRAPIVRVLDETDLGICPHCGLSFSLSAQGGAHDLLKRARQLMPGYV